MNIDDIIRAMKAKLGFDSGSDGPALGPATTGAAGPTPHEGDSYPTIISMLQSTGWNPGKLDMSANPDVIDQRDDLIGGGGYGPALDDWQGTRSPLVDKQDTDAGTNYAPVDQHRYYNDFNGHRPPWGTVNRVFSPSEPGVSRKLLLLIEARKKRYKNWNGVGSDTGGIDDGPE